MRRRALAVPLLLAALALPLPARAAVPAAEAEILRRVGETYRGMRRYLFQGILRVVQKAGGSEQAQNARFFIAADGSGRLRDEIDDPAVGGMIVADGRQTWVYNAGLGQYLRRPAGAQGPDGGAPMRGIAGALIARYRAVGERVTSARRLPDETLTLNGARRECIVLEVSYPPAVTQVPVRESPRIFWIDKGSHLVVRQRSSASAELPEGRGRVEQSETITFDRATLEPALPESLWAFRPPAGAREVAEFDAPTAPGAEDLAGEAAADFTLKDLEGKPHTLKSMRGKVVLLDFWATWCGPCRVTMPLVEKLHREFRGRGVEVWSVNVGEPAHRARDYMRRNGYTFTALLDADRRVAELYRAFAIPTLVVVGRDGRISSYLVGAHPEEHLREALRKAGAK